MRHTANHSLEAIATRDELRASSAISSDDWLHPRELAEFSRLRDAGAREAWRFGRRLGKQLVLEALDGPSQPAATIAICSRNERRRSVRPAITIAEQFVPWSLSISHSERLVAAVLDTRPGFNVGVDVAIRQTFRPGFLRTWFFPSEQEWAQSGSPETASIIWAAKEAVYKALNNGESFAPHMVEIFVRDVELREGEAPAELTFSLCARYRGRDVSSECEIECRTLDRDVVVIARRWESLSCIELSRQPDGARDLVGEN